MIEVHFYKDIGLKYSVYANSIEDVIESPRDYYDEYTTDMIISSVKYNNAVLDNGELREATREELVAQGIEVQLEDGELIKEKKLIKIEQPSIHHKWNGQEWICDLEEVKKVKREELKQIRDEKIHENIEVHGSIFQVRESDTVKFQLIGLGLALGKLELNGKEKWVLADNSVKEFTNSELIDVLMAKEERERKIFAKFVELDMQLQASSTVEEIEAIKWE